MRAAALAMPLLLLPGPAGLAAQARTVAAETHPPYDLVSSQRDVNGLLLNPSWGTGRPATSLDPAHECGIFAVRGAPGYRGLLLRRPGCFSDEQRRHLRLVEPQHFVVGGAACNQAVEDGTPHGHLNWFPVTLTGGVRYNGSLMGKGGDFDFTFEMYPDRPSPATKWNHTLQVRDTVAGRRRDTTLSGLHLEFDFRETTDRLVEPASSWWRTFARLSQSNRPPDKARADSLLGLGRAVVTGLFNLDLVHYGHSEIHPVYAMAVLRKIDTAGGRERHHWVFMARDRGNEGNCAPHADLPFRLGSDGDGTDTYRFSLGQPEGTVTVPSIDRTASFIQRSGAITSLTFHWSLADGLELRVQWPRPATEGPDAIALGEVLVLWPLRGAGADSSAAGESDKVLADPGMMQQTRRIRRAKAGEFIPERGAVATGRGTEADDEHDRSHRGIVNWTGWSSEVMVQPSLPPAAPLPFAPSQEFERLEPVLDCGRVKWESNPRCGGDFILGPMLGLSPRWPSILGHVALEHPRHYIGGPVARIRYSAGFFRKLADTVQGSGRTQLYAQGNLVLGPVKKYLTAYFVLSPAGFGYEWGEDAGMFYTALAGVELPLRSGYRAGYSLTAFYQIRSGGGPFAAIGLRVPFFVESTFRKGGVD